VTRVEAVSDSIIHLEHDSGGHKLLSKIAQEETCLVGDEIKDPLQLVKRVSGPGTVATAVLFQHSIEFGEAA
jgi:hypothetical protein